METFRIKPPHSSSEGLGMVIGNRLSDEAILEIMDWYMEGRSALEEKHLADYSPQEREVILRAYRYDVFMRESLEKVILPRYRALTNT